VLLGPVIVARRLAPLLLTFVVLSNLQMLVLVFVVMFEDYLCVLVHLLMRLSYHKRVLALARKDQELNRLLLRTFGLAVLSDLHRALGQLTLFSEDLLGPFSVVQVV
jgi:hypothetical protein